MIHRLTYRRANRNLHVRGYIEEGTITTEFDVRVQNSLDRFHLVQDVIDRLQNLGSKGAYLKRRSNKLFDLDSGRMVTLLRSWGTQAHTFCPILLNIGH